MEKLLRGRYGSDFSIDLDKHIVEIRLVKPAQVDIAAWFEDFKRNNLGVESMTLLVDAELASGHAVVPATRQKWPLADPATPNAPLARRTLRFEGFEQADTVRAIAEL